jgi:multidrug efflux pump subunit AcrB
MLLHPANKTVILKTCLVVSSFLICGCGDAPKANESLHRFVVCSESHGRTPEEVERDITIPIEDIFQNMRGIDSISSGSSSDNARVTLDILGNENGTKLQSEIEQELDRNRIKLPKDIPLPVVTLSETAAELGDCE